MRRAEHTARVSCIALALAVVSCGTPPTLRLAPYVIDGGDGALVYTGRLSDTALGLDCEPHLTARGEWRCLPVSDWSLLAYADPTCTARVVVGEDASDSPYYTSELYDGAGPATVYAVDVAAASSGSWYMDRGASGCMLVAVSRIAPAHVVEADIFVRGGRVLEPHGALAAAWFVGDDGSRTRLHAHDVAHDWACRPLWLPDDVRCLPIEVAWRAGVYFGDAACTTQVAYAPTGYVPLAIVADDVASLPVFELGPPVTQGFTPSPTCQSFDDGGHAFWEVGPAIPDSAIPTFDRVEVGTGRLGAIHLAATGDTTPLAGHDGRFFDRARGVACHSVNLHGVARCVDEVVGTTIAGYFADAACTTPLLTSDSSAPLVAMFPDGGGQLREVGAPHVGSVFSLLGGACQLRTDSPLPLFFAVSSTVIPDEAFAPLVTHTL